MDPKQLLKTSKFYSECKKCDIEKNLGDGYHPLGSPKVKSLIKSNTELQARVEALERHSTLSNRIFHGVPNTPTNTSY